MPLHHCTVAYRKESKSLKGTHLPNRDVMHELEGQKIPERWIASLNLLMPAAAVGRAGKQHPTATENWEGLGQWGVRDWHAGRHSLDLATELGTIERNYVSWLLADKACDRKQPHWCGVVSSCLWIRQNLWYMQASRDTKTSSIRPVWNRSAHLVIDRKASQVSRSLVDWNCAICKRHGILSWDTSPTIVQDLFTFTSHVWKGSGLVRNLGSEIVFIVQLISGPIV